ncbi:hypothetical protein [Desertivirga arenae]|uniref:hypothetical protein n=1 Tax=Desertivirga arenae TaxID=2810309 RepID=UPI001A95FD56|nr:hypothetical protein [Pedobacter sp. SYSU D00823]
MYLLKIFLDKEVLDRLAAYGIKYILIIAPQISAEVNQFGHTTVDRALEYWPFLLSSTDLEYSIEVGAEAIISVLDGWDSIVPPKIVNG